MTTRRRRACRVVSTLVFVIGCGATPGAEQAGPEATPVDAKRDVAKTNEPGAPSEADEDGWADFFSDESVEPPIPGGPARPDAAVDREAREAALFELLAGERTAARLPLRDVEPGAKFDEFLVDRMAPRRELRGRVTSGKPRVVGDLDRELVRATVEARNVAFRRCYDEAFPDGSLRAGTIAIELTVTDSGWAEDAKVKKSSFADAGPGAELRKCFVEEISALTFTVRPGAGDVTVVYPFDLHPR